MNAPKTPFSYVVLRYMHDALTREFVNIGVLLYAPGFRFLGFEKLPTFERVKGMFPGAHSESLRQLLMYLSSRTEETAGRIQGSLDASSLSAETIATGLLPMDDSALQWSSAGGGVTGDPEQILKELFERLVLRHLKAHPVTRRDDGDVWKPFERELRRRDVLQRFQEKVLSVGELRHRFENTWQPSGSYLRLYQPLSLDLLEPSGIVEKAVRWRALIGELRKAEPEFFIYLLLGRPSESSSNRAYKQACETLAEQEGRKRLVSEEEAPQFAEAVEREVKSAVN